MVMLATVEAGISTSPSRTTNNSPASLGNQQSRKRNMLWIPGIGWTVRSSLPTMSSHTTDITTASRSTTSAAKFDTKELEEPKDKRLVKKFKVCLHGHCYKKTTLPTMSAPITASTTRSTTFDAKFGTKELEERKHNRLVKGRKPKVCWNHCHRYKQKLICWNHCHQAITSSTPHQLSVKTTSWESNPRKSITRNQSTVGAENLYKTILSWL